MSIRARLLARNFSRLYGLPTNSPVESEVGEPALKTGLDTGEKDDGTGILMDTFTVAIAVGRAVFTLGPDHPCNPVNGSVFRVQQEPTMLRKQAGQSTIVGFSAERSKLSLHRLIPCLTN
ncbi:MAG: hypothetical protein JJU00_04115 [Opitutales bacterium]|nr:hypothetical protein [Opitutales bacterium]